MGRDLNPASLLGIKMTKRVSDVTGLSMHRCAGLYLESVGAINLARDTKFVCDAKEAAKIVRSRMHISDGVPPTAGVVVAKQGGRYLIDYPNGEQWEIYDLNGSKFEGLAPAERFFNGDISSDMAQRIGVPGVERFHLLDGPPDLRTVTNCLGLGNSRWRVTDRSISSSKTPGSMSLSLLEISQESLKRRSARGVEIWIGPSFWKNSIVALSAMTRKRV